MDWSLFRRVIMCIKKSHTVGINSDWDKSRRPIKEMQNNNITNAPTFLAVE